MNSQKKIGIITSLIMSFAMSLMLSGFFTWLHFGFQLDWLKAWSQGFAMGWPLSIVLVLLIGRPIRQLAERLAS